VIGLRTRNTTKLPAAAAIVALAVTPAVHAHHSAGMFELLTAIWLEGTVVRFDRINPHSIIAVEERPTDGQSRRWAVEGPDPGQLNRRGIPLDFLQVGDQVKVCGFPVKEEFLGRYASRDTDGVPRRYVHGHLIVRNKQKSVWGSYGTFGECIRTSNEPRQEWVEFLNSDPRVQQNWCAQRSRLPIRATPSLKALVEEITALVSPPCA
jgi:hypothetical protein